METTTQTYECYFCDVAITSVNECDYCDRTCTECHAQGMHCE